MTYITANTQREGKIWAQGYLPPTAKFKVLSTGNQIRGHAFMQGDELMLVRKDPEFMRVLYPALCGCAVYDFEEQPYPSQKQEPTTLPPPKKSIWTVKLW